MSGNKDDFRVFPSAGRDGLWARDLFALLAPEPSSDLVQIHAQRDKDVNPHNDNHKPPRRSLAEIRADLRYEWADVMLARRQK